MPTSAWTTAPARTITSGANPADLTRTGYNNYQSVVDATHRQRDPFGGWYKNLRHNGHISYTNRLSGLNPWDNPLMVGGGGTLYQYMSAFAKRASGGTTFVTQDGTGTGPNAPPCFAQVPLSTRYGSTSGTNGYVVVEWQASSSGGHNTATLDVHDWSQTISLYNEQRDARHNLGYTDAELLGFAGWTGPYDYIEFEPGLPTVNTVEVMPDWDSDRAVGTGVNTTDHVLWYAGLTREGGTIPNAAGWGPYGRDTPTGSKGWQIDGANTDVTQTPDYLTASMTLVADYDGGASSWYTLDPALVTAAIAQEAIDVAAWEATGEVFDFDFVAPSEPRPSGIQLVALTGVNIGAHNPPGPITDSFYGQTLAVCWTRINYTAPRFRVVLADAAAAFFPAPAAVGIAPLRQHPRTDGLGTSTTPRQWPPSRSIQASNRRAGGYI